MTIILAEKPSVASSFASALAVPRKGACYENDEFCIVNAIGHLLRSYMPEEYDAKYKAWNLADLPIIPDKFLYKEIEAAKAQLDVIKKCFASHKDAQLLLATDAEREGEVIGAEILNYVGFKNYTAAKRFWVSEALTKDVVLAGIKNARPLNEYAPYKNKGFARAEADWLVGMNLSRFVTKSCAGRTLHVGRVKTAVLSAVCEREKIVTSFVKEKYIEVKAVLKTTIEGEREFPVRLINTENEQFPNRFPENSALVKFVLEEVLPPTDGKITAVKKEKKTKAPPPLFNLTALQKEASKVFSYNPEQTLGIAQSLYEKHKCLSYPRTPSRVMGDENVELVKSIYEKIKAAYPDKTEGVDESLIAADNKRLFNSADLADHHALIPLAVIPEAASKEEKDVYFLVLHQFITTLKPDYIYNSVKIDAAIAGYNFNGAGIEALQAGWTAGTNSDKENEEDAPEDNFAGLEEKEYPVVSIAADEKFTEPKKLYSYATILQLMENPRNEDGKHLVGLGTPATRGNILKDLFDKNYLLLKGKNIISTDDGKFLIAALQSNDELKKLCSVPETTRWEEQLDADCGQFVANIKDYIRGSVKTNIAVKYERKIVELGKCPLCGKPVSEGKLSYSCTGWKEGCKFTIWKEICKAPISTADAELLLAGKKTKTKKCVNKAGKEFQAAFSLNEGRTEMVFEEKK